MPATQCPKCGAAVTKKDINCPQCGAPVSPFSAGSWAPTIRPDRVFNNRTSPLAVGLVVLLAAGFLAFFLLELHGTKTIFDALEFEVGPGRGKAFDFSAGRKIKVVEALSVDEGPAVDIFLLTEAQYQRYRDAGATGTPGEDREIELGALGTSGVTQTATLQKGRYFLVVRPSDNAQLPNGPNFSKLRLTLKAEW